MTRRTRSVANPFAYGNTAPGDGIEGIPRRGFVGSVWSGVRRIGVDGDVGVPSFRRARVPLLSGLSRDGAGGWMGIGGGMGKQ